MKFAIPLLLVPALAHVALGQTHPDIGRLQDFPISNEVWLGSLVGEISVDPDFPVELSRPGELKWQVEDGATVTEKTVIALSAANKLDLAKRRLTQEENRLPQAIRDLESGMFDKKAALRNTIRDLDEKLSRLSLTPEERNLLGGNFEKRLAKEKAELEDELKRAKDKLADGYLEEGFELDKRGLELDLERARQDYEEQVQSSEVLAMDSGVLRIESRDPVRMTTIIARIIKQGLAEVIVELVDPRVTNVPGADLGADIRGDDGQTYRGYYKREHVEASYGARNSRKVVFEIRSQEADKPVPKSLSGSRMVRVFRMLATPGHQVPKGDLLFKFPKEISESGWNTFFEKRWPEARVTYIAPRIVVIVRKDGN